MNNKVVEKICELTYYLHEQIDDIYEEASEGHLEESITKINALKKELDNLKANLKTLL